MYFNSTRLKALQDEIEKLKEGVARANQRNDQPQPPIQVCDVFLFISFGMSIILIQCSALHFFRMNNVNAT